jgi:hypothetical protein
MNNIKGLDIIKEAYTKAISVNIQEGNFDHGKYLLNALEQLTEGIVAVPIVPVKTDAPVPVAKNKQIFGVTTDDMRHFIISYVTVHGMSKAEDVALAFELSNKYKFTADDLYIPDNRDAPNWKTRFHSVASNLRANGTLMPHNGHYTYKYALTEEFKKLVSSMM